MSRYNIETAKSAGFCFGVKRAVEIAEKAAEENGSCYTLGELIHNGSEIARLQKLGVYPIDSPDDLPQGRTLIIRSHGVAKAVLTLPARLSQRYTTLFQSRNAPLS